MSVDWPDRLGVWWVAEDHPDLPAIAFSPSGPRTFGELVGAAHQLVHALRALGVPDGAPVAVLLPNDVDIVVWSLACQEGGWYFLPLNWHLTANELAAILEHAGAVVLVTDKAYAEVARDAVARAAGTAAFRFVVGAAAGVTPGFIPVEQLVAGRPTSAPDRRRSGGFFVYTSGTTGVPKGIRRPRPQADPSVAAHEATMFGRAFGFRPLDGRHLMGAAMYHVGAHSFYLGALHVGQALVIMDRFDAERALRLIDEQRVTTAYMVPTMFSRLLALPPEARNRHDLSSLEVVVHSAAPCPRPVKEAMLAWWGPVIWETYGGSEGAATIAKPHRWLAKPGTVGRAVRGVRVSVLDEDGRELPPGDEGLVYLETEDEAFEYHRDREGTKDAFRGARFTLGDVGYLDEDGYLFIRDRAKDMIISGGVNIYPSEVEAMLLTHPDVADVAVIGVPNDEWGEEVKAVVVPREGVQPSPALAATLIAHARDGLARFKCPRTVDFRTELPRTEAGKLYKRRIRDEYWASAGRLV